MLLPLSAFDPLEYQLSSIKSNGNIKNYQKRMYLSNFTYEVKVHCISTDFSKVKAEPRVTYYHLIRFLFYSFKTLLLKLGAWIHCIRNR